VAQGEEYESLETIYAHGLRCGLDADSSPLEHGDGHHEGWAGPQEPAEPGDTEVNYRILPLIGVQGT
jgi:hypothetical protein